MKPLKPGESMTISFTPEEIERILKHPDHVIELEGDFVLSMTGGQSRKLHIHLVFDKGVDEK